MGRTGWRRRLGSVVAPWWRRLRATQQLYRDRQGDHLAAAVTFFTVLSLVPLLMLVVSAAGFVLTSSQSVSDQVDRLVAAALPPPASAQVVGVVHVVVAERGTLGVAALAAAVFSGWSWISNLRDAVTALLGLPRPGRRRHTALADIGSLLGIGLALTVSFALAALTGVLGTGLLDLLGLAGTAGARWVLGAGSVVIGLAANWLVVAWCMAHLPRPTRPLRAALPAAAVAAVGLGVLQQLGGLYFRLLGSSPAVTTLGALVGLLLFVYLVVRWLFLVTVWTTTRDSTPEAGDSEAGRTGIGLVLDVLS